MSVVYKYPIPIEDVFEIEMPVASEVLTVQVQNGMPCIWVQHFELNSRKVPFKFRLAGTGHELGEQENDYWRYIGTFQLTSHNHTTLDATLVFHLFEMDNFDAWEHLSE